MLLTIQQWLATDNTTFLRGMWPTNRQGVTSFTTIFPGFYVGVYETVVLF